MNLINWTCAACKGQWWMYSKQTPIRCPLCEKGRNTEYFLMQEWKKTSIYKWAMKKTGNNK